MLKPLLIALLALTLSACGLLDKVPRSSTDPSVTPPPSTPPVPTTTSAPKTQEVIEFSPPELVEPAKPSPQVETHPHAPPLARSQPAPGTQATPALSPAVIALLGDAERLMEEGQLEQSAARLERALRIEPNNGLLWQRLAMVRLNQGQLTQAETLALRANEFARGDRKLMARNWRIIAKARTQRGDERGAAEALQRARDLDGVEILG